MSVAGLVRKWRDEAALYRRRGLPLADVLDSYVDELEVCLRREREAAVNLTEGARLSGFTADHLGRLIKDGKIENMGRKGAPLIRVSDLPKKAGCDAWRGRRSARSAVTGTPYG